MKTSTDKNWRYSQFKPIRFQLSYWFGCFGVTSSLLSATIFINEAWTEKTGGAEVNP